MKLQHIFWGINPTKTLCKKYNFTISPFGYSVTKHPITDSRLKREFENNDKNHSHLNLKLVMNLEQNTCIIKYLHKTH